MIEPLAVASVRFDVVGLPKPQGSKVAFINKATGHAGMKEASERGQRAWRGVVALAARDACDNGPVGMTPFDGPLGLTILFRLPCPKARAEKAPCWHIVSPDLSKLLRSTEDGLVDGGLIVDDRLICSTRMWAIEVVGWTGAHIRVEQVPPWTSEGLGTEGLGLR